MLITAAGSPATCTNASPLEIELPSTANANQPLAPDGGDFDKAAILHRIRDRAHRPARKEDFADGLSVLMHGLAYF
jgi:hypothetical protein